MKKSLQNLVVVSFLSFVFSFFGFLAISGLVDEKWLLKSFFLHAVLMATLAVLSFYLVYLSYISYKKTKDIFIYIISLVFSIFGFVFTYHAITIPGWLFFSEAVFDIFEHTGLFFGSLIFILFTIFSPYIKKDSIYENKSDILFGVIIFLMIYPVFVLGSPFVVDFVVPYINIIIILTAVLFFVNAILFVNKYIKTCNVKFYYLAISFSILINTGIIPFYYHEWNALWWYFHLVLLLSFVVMIFGILKQVEEKKIKNII